MPQGVTVRDSSMASASTRSSYGEKSSRPASQSSSSRESEYRPRETKVFNHSTKYLADPYKRSKRNDPEYYS
ncbi:MAG: hypothetical protein MMC33_007456 [Icmadophila ericetorum]|nr:hypothetical protein [Icmadophila ericetorum]